MVVNKVYKNINNLNWKNSSNYTKIEYGVLNGYLKYKEKYSNGSEHNYISRINNNSESKVIEVTHNQYYQNLYNDMLTFITDNMDQTNTLMGSFTLNIKLKNQDNILPLCFYYLRNQGYRYVEVYMHLKWKRSIWSALFRRPYDLRGVITYRIEPEGINVGINNYNYNILYINK